MDTSANEGTTHTLAQGGEASALAELRKSVSAIGEELSTVIERRGRALKESTEAGANSLRRSIRRQPVAAIGIATLAGALFALALVPRISRDRIPSRWAGWVPQVSGADLYNAADSLQRSLARATSTAPLTSSLERLVDALTRIDSKESLSEMLQKAGSWFQRVRRTAS
jgi:hypothetical protein